VTIAARPVRDVGDVGGVGDSVMADLPLGC